jgi:DNA processing protein
MEEILLYFSLKYDGDFEKIYQALENKETVDEEKKKELLTTMNCKYVTIVSKAYPEALKHINCPPFVLYYYGDLALLKGKNIGVVGMRIPSSYGIKATKEMVNDLVKYEYTIVSGLALGVDVIAHRTVIENGGKTIAVLGSGIDYCYPKRNMEVYEEIKKHHLLISEYPNMVPPLPTRFPKRNRIIAGVSENILVTEAMLKSGTMITVGYALEQGKDIFCIPGRMSDYLGCNHLIQQGAKLVNKIEDILEG